MEKLNTPKQLLSITELKPTELIEAIYDLPITGGTDLRAVFKMQTGQISGLVVNSDKQKAIAILKLMITRLGEYFIVTFSDFQITEFSKTLYDKFFYWHMGDIKKFVEMCKGLEFGKPYGAVGVATIMEWANAYDAARWEMINGITTTEIQQRKQDEKEFSNLLELINEKQK